jgi:hypothetical protein
MLPFPVVSRMRRRVVPGYHILRRSWNRALNAAVHAFVNDPRRDVRRFIERPAGLTACRTEVRERNPKSGAGRAKRAANRARAGHGAILPFAPCDISTERSPDRPDFQSYSGRDNQPAPKALATAIYRFTDYAQLSVAK